MSLAGMLDKLYARRRFGIRPGVERVQLLLDRLGHPERSFRSIHVVGTNGKGSTSAFLASILQSDGQKTALFTSPHLIHFSERFRVNGQELSADLLEARLQTVLSHAPADATFFEIVTALAAYSFAEDRVDIAVMEAGMGGRSDATAALPGIMTLVTPISLDHGEFLGHDLAGIAAEKAGIIEPATVALVARQAPPVQSAIDCGCPPSVQRYQAGVDFSAAWSPDCRHLRYDGIACRLESLEPGITGRFQTENAGLALAAAELLLQGPDRTAAMRRGLAAARWPGRMELIPGTPPLLLDGAHNPAGAAALAEALADYQYGRLLVVIGVMAEKDLPGIVAPLAPLVSEWLCVTPAVERALDHHRLADIVGTHDRKAIPCGDVAAGISTARERALPGDLILVCGSLFTVGEAKARLQGQTFEGIRG